jgi:sulfopyruvate decarboxylase TPP-binding subunit
MTDQASWANPLYDYLVDDGVTLFTYVPDAGHKVMILRSLADKRVRSIPLTTEEEGVAMAAGAHLGGGKAVLLMQSSGTGNCINMLSLIKHGRFPFVTFVTMRGDFGEENPWQIAMGQAVRPALESIGVICLPVERPDEVLVTAQAAMGMAYKSQCGVAVLLSQKLIGAKGF